VSTSIKGSITGMHENDEVIIRDAGDKKEYFIPA